jgi:hypothetical protein
MDGEDLGGIRGVDCFSASGPLPTIFEPASPFALPIRSASATLVPAAVPEKFSICVFDSSGGVLVPDTALLDCTFDTTVDGARLCAVDTVDDVARPFAACAYENVMLAGPESPNGLAAAEVILQGVCWLVSLKPQEASSCNKTPFEQTCSLHKISHWFPAPQQLVSGEVSLTLSARVAKHV